MKQQSQTPSPILDLVPLTCDYCDCVGIECEVSSYQRPTTQNSSPVACERQRSWPGLTTYSRSIGRNASTTADRAADTA